MQGKISDAEMMQRIMNGEAPEEAFETLMQVAANTCYLHQTMIHQPRMILTVRQGGKTAWTTEAAAAE